jgi:metal-sulfur cluster biosynthetic enzyme
VKRLGSQVDAFVRRFGREAPDPGVPSPAAAGGAPASPDDALVPRVREALHAVIDPELHCNIVDLGLVYGLEVRQGAAAMRMTLTSPGCPYGPYLLFQARTAAEGVPGIVSAKIEVVWEPPWSPALMTEEARLELGFDV